MRRHTYNLRSGTFYLNNTGSRWVVFENGKKPTHTWVTKSGSEVVRTPIYYKQWGNFAVACISYKGKRIEVFFDSVLEG